MKTGVIDVGGVLRGIYAVGVFDYFMDHNIRFDLGIGISAGSANLADNMERKHIYFRGHTDGFSYLKKIGAFKTE